MPQDPVEPKPSRYVYGPVPSRRLGFSLGIDIIPHKKCSYDCIYCQLGKTLNKTLERKEYVPVNKVLEEVRRAIKKTAQIDYLTFSGCGEPTLHARLGNLIDEIKRITSIPVAVLTNGALLSRNDVRNDLLNADLVLPTLCTVNEKVFHKVHRGHAELKLSEIIDGYLQFKKMYKGKIWLELMVLKNINDSPDQIKDLQRVIDKINPDKIHLNTVVRPPSEACALPVPQETLQSIKAILGEKCEIIADFKPRAAAAKKTDPAQMIEEIVARRPVTIDDLVRITDLHKNEILKYLQILLNDARIKASRHNSRTYYRTIRGSND